MPVTLASERYSLLQEKMLSGEPTTEALRHPALRFALATRPAFLSVTVFACFIGLGAAAYEGVELSAAKGLVTLLLALVAHAGINVLNDYYDELSGTDRANTERIFPFTGGSRFIQNEVLTAPQTRVFGAVLLAIVVLGGLLLASVSAPGLIGIGAAGLFIGWAYSAPPLALCSRGLGEPCVALGFGLVVVGTDFVQRGAFAVLPVVAALPYALLVTNVLYLNQFPDRSADEAAGKKHWVVRLGPARARWGYWAIGIAAYGSLLAAVTGESLPRLCVLALLPAVLTCRAGADLLKFAAEPRRLAPAVRYTIEAAVAHGLLLGTTLFLARA